MSEDQTRKLTDKITLRMPDGLRNRIKAEADDNNRSLNAEIVMALEERYPSFPLSATFFLDFLASVAKGSKSDDQREEGLRLMQGLLKEATGHRFDVYAKDGEVSFRYADPEAPDEAQAD